MLRSVVRSPLLPVVRHHLSAPLNKTHPWRLFATENKQNADQTNAQSESNSDNQPSEQASTGADATESNINGSPTAGSEIEQLQKQLEEKNVQIAELNDRALRALAEMENVRMIARRDVDNTRKYAIVPFVKSIVGVADNLGLALNSVDKDEMEAKTEATDPLLKGLYFGVQATESEMLKVFSQYGISRFGAIGDKFDPNKYQAMFEAPSEDHEPGTVIAVQKVGYEMEERVLRPAEVGVSRAP